jgi:methionyl-tRNA formyltransferase
VRTEEGQTEVLKLWQAHVSPQEAGVSGVQPATVLRADAQGVCVACGEGALCITQLQRAGGKRLAAADFLRGFALQAGQRFEVLS